MCKYMNIPSNFIILKCKLFTNSTIIFSRDFIQKYDLFADTFSNEIFGIEICLAEKRRSLSVVTHFIIIYLEIINEIFVFWFYYFRNRPNAKLIIPSSMLI